MNGRDAAMRDSAHHWAIGEILREQLANAQLVNLAASRRLSETEEVNKRLREQLDDALKRLSDALRQKVSDAFLQHEPEPPGSYIRQFLQRRPRSRTPPPAKAWGGAQVIKLKTCTTNMEPSNRIASREAPINSLADGR